MNLAVVVVAVMELVPAALAASCAGAIVVEMALIQVKAVSVILGQAT